MTLNRIYYHWHKNIEPCFFADKLSPDDVQRIEDEIEGDMERENKEELERANDTQYPWMIRFLRRSYRKVTDMFGSLARQLLMCNRIDFSNMFNSSSLFRNVLSTALLPKLGELVSTYLLSQVTGLDEFLFEYVHTPDEELFARNLLGCAVVMGAREVISFGLNYIWYRQWKSIDVDEDLADYAQYVAEIYQEQEQEQN